MAAHQALTFGAVGPCEAVLRELDRSQAQRAALWATTLRAMRELLEPTTGSLPTLDAVQAQVLAEPEIGSRLCEVMGRATRLAHDLPANAIWLELHQRVSDGVAVRLHALWTRFLTGKIDAESVDALAVDAAEQENAEALIEATALRAFVALEGDDLSTATAKARRASRMARTEGAPHADYLANLVLARLRRVTGRSHLAARILSALLEVAPPAWHGWLVWELLLAGRLDMSAPFASAGHPSSNLGTMLSAARAGNADELRSSFTDLSARIGGAHWMLRDALTVRAALDPTDDLVGAPDAIVSWCRGATDDPPAGLHGLCSRDEALENVGACVAYVVAPPHERPRRVLALSLPLIVDAASEKALRENPRQQGRADAAIAVLTLAGSDGLSDEAFFRATYGFEYSPAQHRGVFDVLKHRMRKQLGGYSKLQCRDGHNVLAHEGLTVLPDPRCCQPLSDSVLRALANGAATAKDLARQLSVPLRTAQLALKQLVEEGACMSMREGRQIRYVLEDTTFSEPTRH